MGQGRSKQKVGKKEGAPGADESITKENTEPKPEETNQVVGAEEGTKGAEEEKGADDKPKEEASNEEKKQPSEEIQKKTDTQEQSGSDEKSSEETTKLTQAATAEVKEEDDNAQVPVSEAPTPPVTDSPEKASDCTTKPFETQSTNETSEEAGDKKQTEDKPIQLDGQEEANVVTPKQSNEE